MISYEIFKGDVLINTVVADQSFVDSQYPESEGYFCKKRVSESDIRNERHALLTASDWTQVADAPVDQAAWATYRQKLRDIPDQAGFPTDVNWPIEPT